MSTKILVGMAREVFWEVCKVAPPATKHWEWVQRQVEQFSSYKLLESPPGPTCMSSTLIGRHRRLRTITDLEARETAVTGIEELASMDSDADPDGWSVQQRN